MNKVQNTRAVVADRPHPEWCRTHDHESNVCLGPNITLDLAADNRHNWLVDWANVGMGYCPEEGVDVFIDLPGMGAAYMTPEDAQRLAAALMSLVAMANAGGQAIPAPRTAVNDIEAGAR